MLDRSEVVNWGKRAVQRFFNTVKSIQTGISFDVRGNPSFHLQLGDIKSEEIILDEISGI